MVDNISLNTLINGIILSGLGAGTVFSLRERRKKRQWRSTASASSQGPLSGALAQLVGTAGGIYLSMELLCSFLGLHHETWQALTPLTIDPLAVVSLFIAIIQPYIIKIWGLLRGDRSQSVLAARIPADKNKTKAPKRR